ncbi:MAG: hypothetical protein WC321_07080 [Candidatus Omnitrophota bacterium]|jgi:formate/nitrite transporter FocA (FNT family)
MKRKGQSTLEYVIILTAIVAGIIIAANMAVQPKVRDSLTHVSGQMEKAVEKINYE